MKLKDIKVGEDYAVGSESYSRRGTVLEVGVKRKVSDASGFHLYDSTRADSVLVIHPPWTERDRPTRAYVACRQVLRPWAEQEKINTELREISAKIGAANAAKRRLEAAAPDMLAALRLALTEMRTPNADYIETIATVRAAIAKATGDAP